MLPDRAYHAFMQNFLVKKTLGALRV